MLVGRQQPPGSHPASSSPALCTRISARARPNGTARPCIALTSQSKRGSAGCSTLCLRAAGAAEAICRLPESVVYYRNTRVWRNIYISVNSGQEDVGRGWAMPLCGGPRCAWSCVFPLPSSLTTRHQSRTAIMVQQRSGSQSWVQEALGFSTLRGRAAWAAAAAAAALLWIRPKGWAARHTPAGEVAAGGADYGTGPHTPHPAGGGTVDYGQLQAADQGNGTQQER